MFISNKIEDEKLEVSLQNWETWQFECELVDCNLFRDTVDVGQPFSPRILQLMKIKFWVCQKNAALNSNVYIYIY